MLFRGKMNGSRFESSSPSNKEFTLQSFALFNAWRSAIEPRNDHFEFVR